MVTISELVSRRDKFNKAIITVNKDLKFCRQNGWKFFQHHTSEKELNRGELHLNFKGNQQFQGTFR